MLSKFKSSFLFLALFSVVANVVAAPDSVDGLPFEDGSLLALTLSCLVGLVWLVRNKNK